MSKKVKIILFSIIGLVAVIVPLIFFVFLKGGVLSIPNLPDVVITETNLYVSTNEIQGANSYIFKFTSPDNNIIEISSPEASINIILYDTETNEFLGEFEKAGQYSVVCCAVGNGTKSGFSSSKNFDRYITLERPDISLYNDDGEIMLIWGSINNANRYDIYFTSIEETAEIYEYIPTNNESSIETVSIDELIDELNLNLGNYQIQIVAKNTNDFYIESSSSLPINFEIK